MADSACFSCISSAVILFITSCFSDAVKLAFPFLEIPASFFFCSKISFPHKSTLCLAINRCFFAIVSFSRALITSLSSVSTDRFFFSITPGLLQLRFPSFAGGGALFSTGCSSGRSYNPLRLRSVVPVSVAALVFFDLTIGENGKFSTAAEFIVIGACLFALALTLESSQKLPPIVSFDADDALAPAILLGDKTLCFSASSCCVKV
mmetsp:Transcript_3411/g.4069  ORF Transcript_3411/g.4069 Transcript_3411/m.4069 type:complete len:206 (-) Transcript_3411:635-1252(-)